MDPRTKQMGTMVSGLFVVIIICACCVYCMMQVAGNMKSSPAPDTTDSPSPSPSSGPLCKDVTVSKFPSPASSPAPTLNITAPVGTTISSIDYANLGNSTGVCGAYTDGSCTLYPNSTLKNLIKTACVGKNTCSVSVDPSTFGTFTEPSTASCKTNPKLEVQYRTTNPPSPASAPAPAH